MNLCKIKMRQKMSRTLPFVLGCCVLASVVPNRGAASINALSEMSASDKASLERRITEVANNYANSYQHFEGDRLPIHINAVFDPTANSLIVNMDERFGPMSTSPEMEDFRRRLEIELEPYIDGLSSFSGLRFRFGGKDMYFWFPEERDPPAVKDKKRLSATGAPVVAVSAGHGYYYHHGYKDWRPQRSPYNGILEDEITLVFASLLFADLYMSNTSPVLVREGGFGQHKPSGQPWQMMGARYLLEDSMPNRPDIWHSLPDATEALRDYKEDIRSRPLYANELGADAVFHLHTNAVDNSATRGAKVVVQEGRVESIKLGSAVLCYMKEQIHAQKDFKGYPVSNTLTQGNYGENRLAAMPSVIIEMGFHTNTEDAKALKDIWFQNASMRGVAKGYKLFKEGKGCEEFTVETPAAAEGMVDDLVPIPVRKIRGFPSFPVTVIASRKECATGSSCESASGRAKDESAMSEFALGYKCVEADVARSPFTMVVSAKDSDDVFAKPIEISLTCKPRPVEPESV
ncbi:N-acetylmuramoyl-L-alanine amidase [Luteibacter aegosomatis]|uniref:N-acetylmuramoyl-L-alanine amidase family protein n=1 Tax=Luteibacter aegosomatis TaxID=2911537 RepID=UPI001FF763C2|nr:N-acetylmuramoyl-L-alanine amidase [Luteibacter aegosomatis]UPG86142.1 N-acetylmuramoyl-L-alanine amidase [Luteibacter aegosomatis]